MRSVCEAQVANFYKSGQTASGLRLRNVAETFVTLQEQRHVADYDNAVHWLRTDAIGLIDFAKKAFEDWGAIRNEPESEDFLLRLFLQKPPRQ